MQIINDGFTMTGSAIFYDTFFNFRLIYRLCMCVLLLFIYIYLQYYYHVF